TSNNYRCEWQTTVFGPLTRLAELFIPHCLIMDRNDSHMTSNVVRHCMDLASNLFVLPMHTSHVLQLLKMSVFSLLKHTLAAGID
ncbi:MAG: hypothetical protein FE78DRAFT_122563, partial [Acidomyces sp. 'richmondensis']